MRKINKPKLGEYVLATKYRDRDTNDPWYVSFVTEIIERVGQKRRYKVEGSNREWRNVFRITKEEGEEWLNNYTQQQL